MTEQSDAMASRDRKGWTALAGSALAVFFTGTNVFGYFGVVRGTLEAQFPGQPVSLTMTFLLLAIGAGFYVSANLHDKLGTRKMFFLGALIQLLAILCIMFAQNAYMCWMWGALTGLNSACTLTPGLTTVQNWFPNRRGVVTGVVNLCFGGAGAIMSPILNVLLGTYGFFTMNVILVVLSVVVTVIGGLIAEMPDRTKMTDEERAAHEQLHAEVKAAGKGKADGLGENMTQKQAIKTKGFWMMWFMWLFMGSAGISMTSLATGYTASIGIAGVMSLTAYNIMNGLSRIIAGSLSDVIGRRWVGFGAFILAAIGYACLATGVASEIVSICICCACVGTGFGTLFAITAPIVTDLFGLKKFGQIFGLIFTAYGFVGGIAGPLVAAAVIAVTGSYAPVFAYLAVFCALAGVFVVFVKKPAPKEAPVLNDAERLAVHR